MFTYDNVGRITLQNIFEGGCGYLYTLIKKKYTMYSKPKSMFYF